MDKVLEVQGLKKYYPLKNALVKALDGVSFSLEPGKTLALVGESGCGKSTLAKNLMKLETPTAGDVKLQGKDINSLPISKIQSQVQMIFQDPYSSINPRKKAWQIIAEPLLINSKLSRKDCFYKALEVMELVGLSSDTGGKYPHMFSGGQRQRIGIARALIQRPRILICDEPVSALDVSIQAQVLNLLKDLQNEFNLSYLFISHDLSVVEYLAHDIMVMYLGKIVESGKASDIFKNPIHPYTRALLNSTPRVKEKKSFESLSGELPSPLNPPSGCSFHKRCPFAKDKCSEKEPILESIENRQVACHYSHDFTHN